MKRPWIAVSFPLLLLTACKASVPAESAATAPAATPSATTAPAEMPTTAAAARIDAGFEKGMPYAELRRRVLAAGWLPLVDPSCRENIGGDGAICFSAPELEACSGDGHCNMHFADAASGREIAVHTYGPIERWNAPGEEKSLAVTGWEVSAVPTQKPSVACPSQDFDAFLKAFASNPDVNRAYRPSLIRVAALLSDDNGDHAETVYWRGAQYPEFNLAYAGGVFHFVDGDDKQDASALKLDVLGDTPDARTVRYGYGMSEGNAFTFRNLGDCWYLVEDPQAPTP